MQACRRIEDVQVIKSTVRRRPRLATGGGLRRIRVRKERRWPTFIIWRWAGPVRAGWTPCLRSLPPPRRPRRQRHPPIPPPTARPHPMSGRAGQGRRRPPEAQREKPPRQDPGRARSAGVAALRRPRSAPRGRQAGVGPRRLGVGPRRLAAARRRLVEARNQRAEARSRHAEARSRRGRARKPVGGVPSRPSGPAAGRPGVGPGRPPSEAARRRQSDRPGGRRGSPGAAADLEPVSCAAPRPRGARSYQGLVWLDVALLGSCLSRILHRPGRSSTFQHLVPQS
jgi:hypothetical protein